jgi:hypothetical protein
MYFIRLENAIVTHQHPWTRNMSISRSRQIRCKRICINKSPKALTITIRCEPEADWLLCLFGLPYIFLCLETFRLVTGNLLSIWLPILVVELIVPAVFESRRKTLYSNYEIWKFEENNFVVSQRRVPGANLARLLLKHISLENMPSKIIDISSIQKIWLERMCNDGGCYYCFGINTTGEVLYMYPPSQDDAFLLKNEIESWLNTD